MTMTIRYSYIDNGTERSGRWTGDEAAAVARAASELDASELSSGSYIYLAETGDYYTVSRSELSELGAALLDGRAMGEAYSIWCASAGRESTDDEIAEVSVDDEDDVDPGVAVDLDSMREKRGEREELRAYVAISIAVNGTSYPVSCMVGVPESLDETCRAAGGYERPYIDVWWSDQGDWASLYDASDAEAVLGALYGQRVAMWRRIVEAREAAS